MGWLAVRSALSGIPRWVWYLLAAAILYRLVTGFYSSRLEAEYQRGRSDERNTVQLTVTKERIRYVEVTVPVRKQAEESHARARSSADELLRKGPGAVRACPPAAAADRREPAAQTADDGGPGLPPAGERADVSWGWLVSRALECDLNLADVKAYRAQRQAIEQPKP